MQEIAVAWAGNSSGRFEVGDTTDQSVPIPVKSLEGARKVEVGSGHVVGLMKDGRERPGGGFSLTIHSGTEKP